MSAAHDDEAPERLGRYTILKSLARGGMAQVFVAQKDGADEICVLKQLLVELEEHETAAKRFHREAHVASFLIHPNIARVTDAGMQGGTFCIAMEFIAGKDVESMMHALMRDGRMLPHEVSVAVALGALEGLAYAHDATDPTGAPLGLVHRDLSPRNVMLSFQGEVKLIDFGLAHGRLDDFKTAPGMILGTLRYVSPEQALTQPVDRRSDIYSLAAVLHEMLTGRFLAPHGKPVEVLKAVVGKPAPLLSELNPTLPRALDAVVAKGLEKDANKRWQNARDFADALRAAAGPLADTAPDILGEFVQQMYPEDVAAAQELESLARRRSRSQRSTAASTLGEEDVGMATHGAVNPRDLSDPDDASSRTRTGYVSPSDDDGSRTRTAMVLPQSDAATRVNPSPFDGLADIGMATRTVVAGDQTQIADPSDQATSVGRRKGMDPAVSTISVDPPPATKKISLPLVGLVGGGLIVLVLGMVIGQIVLGQLFRTPQEAVTVDAPSTPAEPGVVTKPAANPSVGVTHADPAPVGATPSEPQKPDPKPAPDPRIATQQDPKLAKPTPGPKSKPEPDNPKVPDPPKPDPKPDPKPEPAKGKGSGLKDVASMLGELEYATTISADVNDKYQSLRQKLTSAVANLPEDRQKKPRAALVNFETCLDQMCQSAEERFKSARRVFDALKAASE